MEPKKMISAGALVLVLTFASLTIVPVGAATSNTADITLVADADSGVWELQIDEALDCDVVSQVGQLIGTESLSFTITCDTVEEKTCTKVGAETTAENRAYAYAWSRCDSISVVCESNAPKNNMEEYCDDEKTGNSALPYKCTLDVDVTWWQSGSYAKAECSVTYDTSAFQ